MIATKTLFLMVMGLVGGENGGKAKTCRVLARYIRILKFWARLHKTPVTVAGIRTCTRNLSELR